MEMSLAELSMAKMEFDDAKLIAAPAVKLALRISDELDKFRPVVAP
jgi:hypothetical protein